MITHLDSMLLPEAQEMLSSFSSLLNVRIAFFSPDGRERFSGLGRPVCDYCRMLRADPAKNSACTKLDQAMCNLAREKKGPVSYICHGRLTEAVLPVFLQERCVGFLMVGQFRIRENKQTVAAGRPAMQKAYRKTPVFTAQQMEDMLRMLRLMVEFIAGRYLVRMKDFDVIQPVIDRIIRSPGITLTVRAAAEQIGRSPSCVAHRFRQVTGRGVRQFQIAVRLEEADRLLQTFPKMPIKEIALRTGFEDPLYFSRVYRRHRGSNPSEKRRLMT